MSDLELDTLESKGLIQLATINPELEYLFRHALIQDTAYDSLLKQERRALHMQVGEAMEQLYPERRADLAAVLALHFEQAGDTARAIDYLLEAAQYASDRNAIVEAFDLYTRANALLPAPANDEDEHTRRLRVQIALGRTHSGFGFLRLEQHLEIVGPALETAKLLGDLRLEADLNLQAALVRGFMGELPEHSEPMRRAVERVSEIGRELNDPTISAQPRSLVGLYQVFTGRLRAGVETLSETAPLLADKRDFVGSSFARMALGMGYARLGEFDKADVAIAEAVREAKDGDLVGQLDAMIGDANVKLLRGDLDAAIPRALECTAMAEANGATACVVGSNMVLGDAHMQLGDFDDAKIAFDRGADVADVIRQGFGPALNAFRRANSAYLGDFEPGIKTFEEGLEEARANNDPWSEASVRWKRAEAEARRGDDANVAQMLADFESAERMFAEMGARPIVARVQRAWGEALLERGRRDDGATQLGAAQQLFTALGLEREASEVRQLTAA